MVPKDTRGGAKSLPQKMADPSCLSKEPGRWILLRSNDVSPIFLI